MKPSERKARVREMLAADSGEKPHTDWARFKQHMQRSLISKDIPQLEIRHARSRARAGWLAGIAAAMIGGVIFFAWLSRTRDMTQPDSVALVREAKPATRTMQRGDVYRSGRREIRFVTGSARFTTQEKQLLIEATVLKADFKLNEKTNLVIEHPLAIVQVTGTQFVFDADAKGGVIRLTQGSLSVALRNPPDAEPVLLRAPVLFRFSRAGHRQTPLAQKKSATNKPLYRYELVSGEVLYAEQIVTGDKEHRVQLLGGKEQSIRVADIASVGPALSE